MRLTKIPLGEKTCDNFQIKIGGQRVEAFTARVSAMPFNCVWPGHQRSLDQTEEQPFVTFSMDKPTEIELVSNVDFKEAVVRPLSDNIVPEIEGRTIRFTVERAGQYTVELDGLHNVLYIFANPEKDFEINIKDENVIYYPAGVHKAGLIELKSNQTLYLEEGAVVYGSVRAINAENIRILGYGILDGGNDIRTGETLLVAKDIERRNSVIEDAFSPIVGKIAQADEAKVKGTSILKSHEQFTQFLKEWKASLGCVHFYGCKNAEINGVVLRDSSGFTVIEANCENAVCDNVKLIGMWRYNSDGIDLFNCRNCVIRNSFLRDFDDCVVLKGIPGWDEWNMENILVENCVVWCDWGASLEIGAETVADEYRNIIFRDCDLIHNSYAALRIHNCDRAYVHNVLYEDIRVEYSKYDAAPVYQAAEDQKFEFKHFLASLIVLFFDENAYYSNVRLKGKISDIKFKNITVLSDSADYIPEIVLEGLSQEHNINGVTLENVSGIDKMNVRINEFCENINII